MRVLLGLTRNYARSPHGSRVCDIKLFYRWKKIPASEVISIKKVVALMRMNDSMDVKAFEVFIEKFLVAELASGSGSSKGSSTST